MSQQSERNSKWLWGLVVLALAYSYVLYALQTLTGNRRLDGSLGVVLGLYICSHPAANAIDLIFSERGPFRRAGSGWLEVGWLALNLLVLLLGLMVIIISVMRLVD